MEGERGKRQEKKKAQEKGGGEEIGKKPGRNRNEMGTKFEKIEEDLGAVEADLPGGWTKSQRRTDDRRIFKDKVDL